jgi:alpha-mannosidase
LIAVAETSGDKSEKYFLDLGNTGYELSSITCEGKNILARIFNAAGTGQNQKIYFPRLKSSTVTLVELDGRVIKKMDILKDKDGKSFLNLSMPRFGIRTLSFSDLVSY